MFAGVVAVFVLLGLVVVPPVIEQGTQLIEDAPATPTSSWTSVVRNIDRDYQVVDKVSEEFNKRLTDSGFLSRCSAGCSAPDAVVTGIFQFFTVMILVLFFLGTLPKVSRRAAFGWSRSPGAPESSRSPRRSCGGPAPTRSARSPWRRSTPCAAGS